jgi:hypothetical protein
MRFVELVQVVGIEPTHPRVSRGRQAAVIANWHRRSHSTSSRPSQPRRHRRRHVLQRLAQIAGLLAMNQPHVK